MPVFQLLLLIKTENLSSGGMAGRNKDKKRLRIFQSATVLFSWAFDSLLPVPPLIHAHGLAPRVFESRIRDLNSGPLHYE